MNYHEIFQSAVCTFSGWQIAKKQLLIKIEYLISGLMVVIGAKRKRDREQ